jgi:cell division protein FtsZ
VAVVTKPFAFEGKRQKIAQQGLEELARHVDSLIVIPNEKLMAVLGEDISMLDAFKAANGVLHGAVAGIAEALSSPWVLLVAGGPVLAWLFAQRRARAAVAVVIAELTGDDDDNA